MKYGNRMTLRIYDPDLERLSRGAVIALQEQRLQHLLQKTLRENPFYRSRWSNAGASLDKIATVEDFASRIPTVEKQDFVADQRAAPPFGLRHQYALKLGGPLIVANTSGTSGQGVEIHAQTEEEFEHTARVYGFHMKWCGLGRGDGVFLTLPITLMSGGRCEFQGAVRYGLSVFPVGNYDAARKLELMERYRPKALFGTTSYFGHLAAVSGRNPAEFGLKVLMTGGEGSGFAWLERLENVWGAKVFDRYGSTQAGNDHMFSCEAGIGTAARPAMMHNIDPMVLLEVVDPATGRQVKDGETGEIVITSLYHTDTPLIRCRTRDRGVWREHRYCSCGRPFAGVEVASIGRLDDMKKVKGVNIWPQAVDDVLFADAGVDEYQVVLTSDEGAADVATVRVMLKDLQPAEQHWQDRLGESLQKRIGIRFRVELVPRGGLARSEYKAKRWLDQRVHVR
jgi:phenylacetate-CoA ligase